MYLCPLLIYLVDMLNSFSIFLIRMLSCLTVFKYFIFEEVWMRRFRAVVISSRITLQLNRTKRLTIFSPRNISRTKGRYCSHLVRVAGSHIPLPDLLVHGVGQKMPFHCSFQFSAPGKASPGVTDLARPEMQIHCTV